MPKETEAMGFGKVHRKEKEREAGIQEGGRGKINSCEKKLPPRRAVVIPH